MNAPPRQPPKLCATCGRTRAWRARWAACWDEVHSCSAGCRRRLSEADHALEAAFPGLLDQRGGGATSCRSGAACAVRPEAWRSLLDPARAAARRRATQGRIDITEKGRPVDLSTTRGPIRSQRR